MPPPRREPPRRAAVLCRRRPERRPLPSAPPSPDLAWGDRGQERGERDRIWHRCRRIWQPPRRRTAALPPPSASPAVLLAPRPAAGARPWPPRAAPPTLALAPAASRRTRARAGCRPPCSRPRLAAALREVSGGERWGGERGEGEKKLSREDRGERKVEIFGGLTVNSLDWVTWPTNLALIHRLVLRGRRI